MKRFFVLTALWLGAMVLIPLTSTYAAGVKIGVIDTQKIVRESRAAKKARSVFQLTPKRLSPRT